MAKVWVGVRNGLALVGALAIGFWLGAGRTVNASSSDSGQGVQFQLTGVDRGSSLLVYHPGTKTVYLYQEAMVGNAALQCTYMFQMDRPGDVIRRMPCGVGKLIP
jgi:hypothetical protein